MDVEDKTCRICGFVDTSNINIFDSKWNSLLNKILTVFPIIIYKTDPLPKNICRKCVTNVSLMYDETTKLFRVQKKWIDNVRINQPNHPYFKIIDLIKSSNREVLTEVRTIEPNFPNREPRLYHINSFSNDEITTISTPTNSPPFPKGRNSTEENKKKDIQKKSPAELPLQLLTKSKEISIAVKKSITSPDKQSANVDVKPVINEQIKELQHKLQSNGCTLMSLSGGNKSKPPVTAPPLPSPASQSIHSPPLPFQSNGTLGEKCNRCNAAFSTEEILAKHQLTHLSVSDRRIFDKKYLEKKVRRGRLIPKGDKKCIRCLNCWKLFLDHRCILNHWSNGDCDFYCQICGKEFPNNPKMLREHVPGAHGISYRSSRRRTSESFDTKTIKTEPTESLNDIKIKTEPLDVSEDCTNNDTSQDFRIKSKGKGKNFRTSNVYCDLCGLEFSNFRSKNSHMRIHKNRNSQSADNDTLSEVIIKQEKEDPSDDLEYMDVDESEERPDIINGEDSNEKPRVHVKKLSDLQSPSVSSRAVEVNNLKISKREENEKQTIQINKKNKKAASGEDHMEYGKIYNCHPCGKQFASKTELFEHKRKCQSNNKFACGFCLRAFITSADLQMHIMLMHRDS